MLFYWTAAPMAVYSLYLILSIIFLIWNSKILGLSLLLLPFYPAALKSWIIWRKRRWKQTSCNSIVCCSKAPVSSGLIWNRPQHWVRLAVSLMIPLLLCLPYPYMNLVCDHHLSFQAGPQDFSLPKHGIRGKLQHWLSVRSCQASFPAILLEQTGKDVRVMSS